MTTLENLYYGNIAPYEVQVTNGSEYDKVAKLVIQYDEALTATLTVQQKEIYNKFKEVRMNLLNLGERNAFIRGFSLGVQIIVEAIK